jgi:hypothetical protein
MQTPFRFGLSFTRLRDLLVMVGLLLSVIVSVVAVSAQEEAASGSGRAVDMRVIIDMSSSLSRGKAGAMNWLCDTLVDRTLRNGDALYLVAAGETYEVIFDGVIGDSEQKEAVKEKIRTLGDPSGESHAAKTLERVFAARTVETERVPVTMIVCGTDITAEGSLLRYSRTENFAYWRVITVANGLDEEVNRALRKALP